MHVFPNPVTYFEDKIFVVGQKPRNQQKFSPSKILGYTVY